MAIAVTSMINAVHVQVESTEKHFSGLVTNQALKREETDFAGARCYAA
jgi:hypothetical protein